MAPVRQRTRGGLVPAAPAANNPRVRIDSHQHFWRYSAAEYPWMDDRMQRIQRDFLPDDLAPLLAACGLDGSVAVQARSSLEETHFLLDLAREHDCVKAVVGWADLCADDVDATLDQLCEHRELRGLRHVVQDEPDDQFLLRTDFQRGVGKLAARNLVYDILIYPRQLDAAVSFVAALPDQPFVLDHIAKPDIANQRTDNWLLGFEGLQRVEIEQASAGDMVAVAGFDDVNIGETIACPDEPKALPLIKVDEPTLQMTFVVNDSPFAGKEGKFVTSRQVRDRLQRELLTNVALRVEDTDSPDRFAVSGRGELHLGILIETMRREGYEFQVSQPQVIFRTIDGTPCEPVETLVMDVPEAAVGSCIEKLGTRKGEMQNMETSADGRTQLEFIVPSRGLIGFRGEFIRATRGEGIMSHSFYEYRPMMGDFDTRRNGVLIAFEEGTATFYALKNAEDRGQFFISPGTKVYKGMIIGEYNRPQDLEINVCKTKQLTNMRSAGAEELDTLQAPVQMTLERALEYIGPDEMLEVTPESIRLRKLPGKKPAKAKR